MFPLTRPVRQSLATGALLMFTVLPTALVAMYAWRINRPGHIRDVEIELGRQLGLQVTLEAVRYPKPGEVVYQGIVLRQEEPRGKGLTEIARADAGAPRSKRAGADASRREPEAQRRESEAGDGPGEGPDPALRRTSLRPVHLAAPSCDARARIGTHFATRFRIWPASSLPTARTRRSAWPIGWPSQVRERGAS